MHQPIQPMLDESSSENQETGGTLTNQLTGVPIHAVPNLPPLTDMDFRRLEYSRTFSISTTSGFLFATDPLFALYPESTGVLPYKHLALLSSHYFNTSVYYKFIALKHEKARCKILFTWYPGVSNEFDLTQPITFNTDSTTVPSWLTSKGTSITTQTKAQRWIWDIEQSETFEMNLVGANPQIARPTIAADPTQPITAAGISIVAERFFTLPQSMGILTAHIHVPYAPGAICPEILDIVMFMGLTDLETTEYRSPIGTLDYYTYNFKN